MNDTYQTIAANSEGLYREKGSKFLALAYPVANEKTIKEHLDHIKKSYHDARHRCYAWRLGTEMDHTRTFDDGEPAGCAGKPILSQIHSRHLTNILVVVVRYFGGTLLGKGGLKNAYRTAAGDALEHARTVKVKINRILKLEFEYARMNAVMSLIKDQGLQYRDQLVDTSCSLYVIVWERNLDQVLEKLRNIGGCKILETEPSNQNS